MEIGDNTPNNVRRRIGRAIAFGRGLTQATMSWVSPSPAAILKLLCWLPSWASIFCGWKWSTPRVARNLARHRAGHTRARRCRHCPCPCGRSVDSKRVLDQGVRGVIFPFVSDPDLAQTAGKACRYPPAGLRGSGAGLATSTWFEPGNYYDSADAHVLTVCVIEEERALAHVDAIAATPGVDVLHRHQ